MAIVNILQDRENDNDSDDLSYLPSLTLQERMARASINEQWVELWRLYKTEPLRVRSDTGWQSKLNDGRTFEIVETVGAYIRNALFYSDYWVELESREPNLADILPLASAYFRDCLNGSNFKREFRVFLVQLLLLGFSGMTVDWCDGKLKFEAINSYNLYIESSRRYDSELSYCFYEAWLNEADFIARANEGDFNLLTNEDAEDAFERLKSTDNTNQYRNQRDTTPLANENFVQLVQFFDPIDECLYLLVDEELIGQQENIDEPPWLISSLFETPETAYAVSLVDSAIGLVLENNILLNRRLDNMAVSVDNMWLFIDDGVTNPSDIRTEPGKVITVARPDSLTPLRPPPNNFNVTYQESSLLDTKIDRNIGTGAMVSANTYRSGERVTAEEISSVKEAGGNRLTDVYEHIENTAIIPLLQRAFKLVKENTKKPKVVKLKSTESNVYNYYKLLPDDLTKDYSVKVTASQNVINRDRNIKKLTDFITLVGGMQQFQPFVDWQNLYQDLLVKFGFDEPNRYLKSQEPQADSSAGQTQSPLSAIGDAAAQAGGADLQNAITATTASGQLPQMISDITGQQAPAPEDQAAITGAMTTPV